MSHNSSALLLESLLMAQGAGHRAQCSVLSAQCSVLSAQGSVLRAQGSGLRAQGSGQEVGGSTGGRGRIGGMAGRAAQILDREILTILTCPAGPSWGLGSGLLAAWGWGAG